MRWTAFYGGVLALIYIWLAFKVIGLRRTHTQGIGDGGHKDLARAIRAHANFAEYVPFALILLLNVEASPAPVWLVHGCGAGLVVGRLMHAQGLARSAGTSVGRYYGMVLTFVVMLVLALYGIWAALAGR